MLYKMDLKIILAFVTLCFLKICRAQQLDIQSLLGLAGGGGGESAGSGGCPLKAHADQHKFIQGGVIKDCAGGTIFDATACACVFMQQGHGHAGGLGLTNLLSGVDSGGGLSDPLSGGLSGGGGLSELLSGGSSGGGLSSILSGGSSGGGLADLIAGSAGGGLDIFSGRSSGGHLDNILSGGGAGGGLADLLAGGAGSAKTKKGSTESMSGGGKSTGGIPGLESLFNQLATNQGGGASPSRPAPTAPSRSKPVKPTRNSSSRINDAMRRILERTHGSKPSSVALPSRKPPQTRRRQSSSFGRPRRPSPTPPSRRTSATPPTRRRRLRPRGPDHSSLDNLLNRMGISNPTPTAPSFGGRKSGGSGRQASNSAGSQRASQRRPTSSQQGPSDMARLLALIEPPRLGGGGGIPLNGGGGPLQGSSSAMVPGLNGLLAGLSGGLGSGGLGSPTRLGAAAALVPPAVPDLTSILNRRGAMMAMSGSGLRNLRNINPAVLANLDRQGIVDISDLTPQGLMALGSMMR